MTAGSGDTTLYGYDLANHLISVTDPVGNVTSYTVDGDGQATLVVANGHTTSQAFDGDGRVTQTITPNGATIATSYDGAGRKTGDGHGNFTYDGDRHMWQPVR